MADLTKVIPALASGTTLANAATTPVSTPAAATAQTSTANGASYVQASVNAIVTDVTSLYTGLAALRTALINAGII